MLEWLFGKNKTLTEEPTTRRKPPIPIKVDPIDTLIRKIVPEEYLNKNNSLGTIYDKNFQYKIYISCTYKSRFDYYIQHINIREYLIETIDTPRSLYSRTSELSPNEVCAFVNQHFDQITKMLQEYVTKMRQIELDAIKKKQDEIRCQEKLANRVTSYCNQNL